ncbi:MAG: Uma2 family endonuclease [Aquificaceae bacterium]|jgi:Uma2 family endonuclease|uniref:Uma2 family endonuclease n=1 Tax=Hydrogenobacter sp. Uz 6-8 TaxID=3384828 RepID=UPI0030AA367E
MAVKGGKRVIKKSEKRRVPEVLIYEMKRGKPIYYRDYQKVLSGEKTPEEVMGSSKIQWFILYLIYSYLVQKLDRNRYIIATNEAGFKTTKGSWRNLDIAIFEKEKLLREGIDHRYTAVAPEVVIEIDTKADLTKYGDFMNYCREKTQELLDAGVKKVIWYTTFDKKVMIAEEGKKWFITGWDEEVEIIEDIKINLQNLLEEEIEG